MPVFQVETGGQETQLLKLKIGKVKIHNEVRGFAGAPYAFARAPWRSRKPSSNVPTHSPSPSSSCAGRFPTRMKQGLITECQELVAVLTRAVQTARADR